MYPSNPGFLLAAYEDAVKQRYGYRSPRKPQVVEKALKQPT
jgi:hypothetical protein